MNSKVLSLLQEFESYARTENYSQGFYTSGYDDYDKAGIKTWSTNPDFYNAFEEFAQANGSGSSYAFWLINENLDDCPIVCFGDEGGLHIVAENLIQLIQLLTLDTEISINFDEVYFYKDPDEDEDESEERNRFLDWAFANFKITPLQEGEEGNALIKKAQNNYKTAFDKFVEKFVEA